MMTRLFPFLCAPRSRLIPETSIVQGDQGHVVLLLDTTSDISYTIDTLLFHEGSH